MMGAPACVLIVQAGRMSKLDALIPVPPNGFGVMSGT
jgi:hypothetical protein